MVAPPGLGDLVARSRAQEGHRSWCLWQPSQECLFAIFLHHQASKFVSKCRPAAGPCRRGPHQLAVLPRKMTPTPWRACPPWGWAGTTSTRLVGPSPHDQTLRQSPRVRQRCGLHWREYFKLESGPGPHHHQSPSGHRLRLQRHPHKPPCIYLHKGHPPLCGRAQIHC